MVMESLKKFVDQFREIQPKFSRLYTRMLDQAGLTQPQYALLLELVQVFPKPISMTEISRKLYITKPAVTNLVDRLEKRRFLKRLSHPKDRRIYLLAIQPPGKKAAEHIRRSLLHLMIENTKAFSGEERVVIQRFYSLLSKKIDEALGVYPKGKS